ncbi:ATP-NAD kinase family protein [Halorubellus sp. JP-L1]|uniref:ATP-NAD kinase family protein n=1 Tax=Halorubellus sp. JP-L1 TaxID=2715753 RepID=UPI00140C57D8|nr:ATP-NAD kinase family protein [Halorubellus sp. JP-L1]NHN42676.1 ATP-NAD kinase family protein [Halorubellus sp. JP-L1]
MRVGFVVNPIAGMGGRVGLKGTDGKVAEARERGAEPRAPERARAALSALRARGDGVTVVTAAGEMGADAARDAGFDPEVVYEYDPDPEGASATSAADTRAAVRAFVDAGVDIVLFVGGDGTAVDVARALEAAGDGTVEVPMLGVPAGVKIYSSVFGVTPKDAGRVVASFDAVADREVNDIDEAAYREGEVRTTLRAVVPVPVAEAVQSSKQVAGGSVDGVASGFANDVEDGVTYVLGPGGTVGAIKRELGFEPSPLGVDVYRDGEVVLRDGTEAEILDALGEENVVVVSPIGGQGFVFGRGNHQISPAVIERSSVEVVASPSKLDDVGVLRVDTDDEAVNGSLRGWQKVRVGRYEHRLLKVV